MKCVHWCVGLRAQRFKWGPWCIQQAHEQSPRRQQLSALGACHQASLHKFVTLSSANINRLWNIVNAQDVFIERMVGEGRANGRGVRGHTSLLPETHQKSTPTCKNDSHTTSTECWQKELNLQKKARNA